MMFKSLLLTTLVCIASIHSTPIKISQHKAVKATIKTTTLSPLPLKPIFPRTELLAPDASSGPQYYYQKQQPNPSKNFSPPGRVEATQYSSYEQNSKEQEQVPFNDFSSLHIETEASVTKDLPKLKITENAQQSQENDWYGYYKPTKEEEKKFFIDLLPPSEIQSEPNYYSALKPRKFKKVTKEGKENKEIKEKPTKKEIEGYPTIEHFTEEDAIDEPSATITPLFPETERFLDHIASSNNIPKRYVLRPPAPTLRAGALRSSELNTGEYFIDEVPDSQEFPKELKYLKEFKDVEPLKKIIKRTAPYPITDATPGEENSRYNFQMHGNDGPKSYKFGFDTGKGKNRQFRLEERDATGNVHGHYGYVEKSGKMKIVKYTSTPTDGFRVNSE